jgi:hypothetical protein
LAWATQDEIEQFDLETETSFFEAQNAQTQLKETKNKLTEEQLDTRQAQEKAEAMKARASEVRAQTQKERAEIEKQRTALKKDQANYKSEIQLQAKEIKQMKARLKKERAELAALSQSVKKTRHKNLAYQAQIDRLQEERRQVAESTVQQKSDLQKQRASMIARQRILASAGPRPAAPMRGPASVKDSGKSGPEKVTLVPKNSKSKKKIKKTARPSRRNASRGK